MNNGNTLQNENKELKMYNDVKGVEQINMRKRERKIERKWKTTVEGRVKVLKVNKKNISKEKQEFQISEEELSMINIFKVTCNETNVNDKRLVLKKREREGNGNNVNINQLVMVIVIISVS